MKKIITIFGLILMGVILYVVFNKEDKNTLGSNAPQINKSKYQFEGIEYEIFKNLWKDKNSGLTINVPGTRSQCILNEIKEGKKTDRTRGTYRYNGEKGEVLFDHNKITIVSKVSPNKNDIYYVAPFYISNQGSGLFGYVGLFKYDLTLKLSGHLDSYFLGDRIDGLKLMDMIQAIDVIYLKHGHGQSYSEEPNKKASFQLGILSEEFKFINMSLDLYPSINIKPYDRIYTPFTAIINSKGLWFASEGELGTIEVVDDYGNALGPISIMKSDSDWMKQGPVMFNSALDFSPKNNKFGKLIIRNNPGEGDGKESGESIRFEIPVRF